MRKKQGARVRVLAALCGLAVFLAAPASAPAGTKSATTTLPGGTAAPGTATAKCPRHQRATGGGFAAPATDYLTAATVAVDVFESRKIGQRSWRVSGIEQGTSPAALSAFVYCSNDASKTKEHSSNVAIAAGNTITAADASCGSSGKAQAGGFLVPTVSPLVNDGPIVDSFRVGGKTWRSRAVRIAGAPTLTSYAYCAKTGAPKARGGSISATGDALVTADSNRCKRGTAIAAGGFSQLNATQGGAAATTGRYFFPWESVRVGKRWRTSAIHYGLLSTTLTSIAYCE
jgi:hypothetical protein